MKKIYACLSGVIVISLVGVASAESLSVGMEVSECDRIPQAQFGPSRFIYKVGDIGGIEDERDVFSGRSRQHPSYNRLDQMPENEGNDDSSMSNGMGNRTMTPSADVPNSVHGAGKNHLPTFPDARPGSEGDPAVRDLSGGGLSEPGGPPGSLGR